MKKHVLYKKINAIALTLVFFFGLLIQNCVPGVFALTSPDDDAKLNLTAKQSLEQRMNRIEDDSLYASVGKHVYDVVNSPDGDAVATDTNGEESTETEGTDTTEEGTKTEDTGATEEGTETEGADATEETTETESTDTTEETTKTEGTDTTEEDAKTEGTDTTEEGTKTEDTGATEEGTKTEDTGATEEGTKTEEEKEEVTYSWENDDDTKFAEWVLSRWNKKYILKLLTDETSDEAKSFYARINKIEDSALYQKIKQHIYSILNPDEADTSEKEEEKEEDKKDDEATDETTENETLPYPWEGMNDEDFAEWVTGGEHDSYIARILSDEEDTSAGSALIGRIADMKDEKLLSFVNQYMKVLSENNTSDKTEDPGVTDETTTEDEAVPEEDLEGEEEADEDDKATYPWDSMNDQDFANWILSGKNNEYIKNLLKEVASEELDEIIEDTKENEDDTNDSVSSKETDEASKETAEDSTDSSEEKSEKDLFNERIDQVEDPSLLQKIKDFIIGLFADDEEELEDITLIDEENNIKVEGKLPANAELQVEKVPVETIEDLVGKNKQIVFAYDITIFVDGEEYQPEEPLSVSVLPESLPKNKTVKVKHVSEDEEKGTQQIEGINSQINEDGEVTFDAEHFSIYFAVVADDVKYVYFDLAAGNVRITNPISSPNPTYSGYYFETVDGEPVAVEVTDVYDPSEKIYFYVYQSTDYNRETTGLINGEFVLPEYDQVMYDEDTTWGEFITDHPNDRTDGDADGDNSGDKSVKEVIYAWEEVTADSDRQATRNSIYCEGNIGNVEIVVDNIWSTKQGDQSTKGVGGLGFNAYYNSNKESPVANNTLTVKFKGDNRFANIAYTTAFPKGFIDKTGDRYSPVINNQNNRMILDVYEDDVDATITVCDFSDIYTGNIPSTNTNRGNHWNSAIGSGEMYDPCVGLVFENGIYYAGTTADNDATAIGAGANGVALIEINGGTITAVSSTSGTAIGAGVGKSYFGGSSDITINDGDIYAYNFSCKTTYSDTTNYIPACAIGGGSSSRSGGSEKNSIKINGGNIFAQAVGGTAIGGGSSSDVNGGPATIDITGGNITAKSISGIIDGTEVPAGGAIGGGTGGTNGNGGDAIVNISGNPEILTGSIGGGGTTNPTGTVGFAKVNMSGGTIDGQFIMAEGSSDFCSFTMTGGTIKDSNTSDEEFIHVRPNGGAIYMDDPNGVATISGGTIDNCSAEYGGAAFINGGNVYITDGTISNNISENDGGAIAVADANIIMSGGKIINNKAISGDGGAFYVSSNDTKVSVDILSGTISDNSSAKDGGAIAVVGDRNSDELISVQIGVNSAHYKNTASFATTTYTKSNGEYVNGVFSFEPYSYLFPTDNEDDNTNEDEDGLKLPFTHKHKGNTYEHCSCPVVTNNVAGDEGGAIFLTGSSNTALDIYCLYEEGNSSAGKNSDNNFLMMEGGACNISTNMKNPDGTFNPGAFGYGNIHLSDTSSSYIEGGTLDVWGTVSNPQLNDYLTVNILKDSNGVLTGHYKDNRPEEHYDEDGNKVIDAYKLHYYENFYGSGTYKAIDIPFGETVTISGNIYTHPGYELLSWNTEPDKTGKKYEVNSVYDPAEYEKFKDDDEDYLVIYAIWDSKEYTVNFDPNVAVGDGYTGSMDAMTSLSYGESYTLSPNKFVYPGYSFTGWNTKPNGSGVSYSDQATFTDLAPVDDLTITLYAQWNAHDDQEDEEDHYHHYTYKADGNTLTRTCTCGLVNTAVLSAEDTVYNGNVQNQAKVNYTSNNSSYKWTPTINHPTNPESINAGTYKATIGGAVSNGEIASIEYKINKVKRPAPAKTVFTTTADGITITPDDSDKWCDDIEYRPVISGVAGDWDSSRNIDIPNFTTYYIEARYKETDNYIVSDASRTDPVFFSGDATITIVAEKGISFTQQNTDGGIVINYTIDDGYYKLNTFGATAVSSIAAKPTIAHDQANSKFTVTNIPNETCEITINISGVKQFTKITTKFTEGQVFKEITQSSAKVTDDSAFSISYDITGYDPANYYMSQIECGYYFYKNTTLILIDKTESIPTYWYYRFETTTADPAVPLTSFRKMGEGTDNSSPTMFTMPDKSDIKLQLIVDASQTLQGFGQSNFALTLKIPKSVTAPEVITELNAVANIKMTNVKITKNLTDVSNLSKSLTYNIDYSGYEHSKYENRRMALVLVSNGDDLPADARVNVTDGQTRATYFQENLLMSSKKLRGYIIPVGVIGNKNISVTLESNMFPKDATEYGFDYYWIHSLTMSGESPIYNGLPSSSDGSFTLTKTASPTPSVKITSAEGGKRIYTLGKDTSMSVKVDYKDIDEWNASHDTKDQLKVVASLMYKNQSGDYHGWGLTKDVVSSGQIGQIVDFALGTSISGDFCIQVEVRNNSGLALETTRYYFIVDDLSAQPTNTANAES